MVPGFVIADDKVLLQGVEARAQIADNLGRAIEHQVVEDGGGLEVERLQFADAFAEHAEFVGRGWFGRIGWAAARDLLHGQSLPEMASGLLWGFTREAQGRGLHGPVRRPLWITRHRLVRF